MKYYRWSYSRLSVPMISTEDGILRVTTEAIEKSLGIGVVDLMRVYNRDPRTYSPLFFGPLHFELGLINKDTVFDANNGLIHLWSLNDMLRMAAIVTTEVAYDYRGSITEFIEEYSKISAISKEEYGKMLEERKDVNTTFAEIQSVLKEVLAYPDEYFCPIAFGEESEELLRPIPTQRSITPHNTIKIGVQAALSRGVAQLRSGAYILARSFISRCGFEVQTCKKFPHTL